MLPPMSLLEELAGIFGTISTEVTSERGGAADDEGSAKCFATHVLCVVGFVIVEMPQNNFNMTA